MKMSSFAYDRGNEYNNCLLKSWKGWLKQRRTRAGAGVYTKYK